MCDTEGWKVRCAYRSNSNNSKIGLKTFIGTITHQPCARTSKRRILQTGFCLCIVCIIQTVALIKLHYMPSFVDNTQQPRAGTSNLEEEEARRLDFFFSFH